MKLGFGKKNDQPVDMQVQERENGQLSKTYPYLEKKHQYASDELQKAQEELLEIQNHVRNIRRQQELYEFIINNQNVKVNVAWLLERIEQIKECPDYDIRKLELEIIDNIKNRK